MKHMIAMAQDDIWNDLLKRRIGFDVLPRPKRQILGIEQARQIVIDARTQALEQARFVKDPRRHHQDLFGFRHGLIHKLSPWSLRPTAVHGSPLPIMPAAAAALWETSRPAGTS